VAVTETHADASPERCFEVLADPRSYAYWVVGSRKIRSADEEWPAQGSRFHHQIVFGIEDNTQVEEVQPNRKLRLRARFRPLGTAFVTVRLEAEGAGTRLRLEEEPADRISKLLHNPLADRLLHHRNVVSIERLKELVEGEAQLPSADLRREPARAEKPGWEGEAPGGDRAGDFGRGFIAGLAGGAAMSLSTLVEMRLSGREPSSVPARAISKALALEELGARGERRVTLVSHFLVAGATGGAWAALAGSLSEPRPRLPLLFGIAVAPDAAIVPAMGLAPPPWRWSAADMGRTVLHHAVFAVAAHEAFERLRR
jgi:uncharacterized protein YndB with AHSA1/START domain